jgi:hypothetical protein
MSKEQKIISLFTIGIIWGLGEILLGNLLQSSILPIRGILLTGLSILAIVTAKKISAFKGSIIFLGIIVGFLKFVSYQTVNHSAIYAVILQAVLAELIFLIINNFNYASVLTGILLSFYTFIHGLVMHGVYFGTHIVSTYRSMIIDVSIFNSINSKEGILIFIATLHLLIGFIWGVFSLYFSNKIKSIVVEYIY